MTSRNATALFAVLFAGFTLCADLEAQDLKPGMRVRLYADSSAARHPFVGTIASADSAVIVLTRASTGEPIEMPVSVIEKYEVSLGRAAGDRSVWDGVKRGGLFGLALGIAGGVLVAYVDQGPSSVTHPGSGPEYGKHVKRGALYAGSTGVLIGAVAGWRIRERWSPAVFVRSEYP